MSTKPAAQQRVFLVRGLGRIREIAAADILVCEKMTWAHVGTRRFLLGTSAFFTRAAAEKRKLAELRKIVAGPRMPDHMGGLAWEHARTQIKQYEETGTLH